MLTEDVITVVKVFTPMSLLWTTSSPYHVVVCLKNPTLYLPVRNVIIRKNIACRTNGHNIWKVYKKCACNLFEKDRR
ncbi:MAG: hypothetical protein L3V56_11605 [Candidatus Magnetoovum sp. WYHC-5]|nr:hypothetical protein [Candidatus Magnetoovum sp. WYHC-5]